MLILAEVSTSFVLLIHSSKSTQTTASSQLGVLSLPELPTSFELLVHSILQLKRSGFESLPVAGCFLYLQTPVKINNVRKNINSFGHYARKLL